MIKEEMGSQMSLLVRWSKTILDSGFYALDSLSLDFGFRISCQQNLDSGLPYMARQVIANIVSGGD